MRKVTVDLVDDDSSSFGDCYYEAYIVASNGAKIYSTGETPEKALCKFFLNHGEEFDLEVTGWRHF